MTTRHHAAGHDEVPHADAAEQQRPVEDGAEAAGLDLSLVAEVANREANAADVIDQAVVVPLPEDHREFGYYD